MATNPVKLVFDRQTKGLYAYPGTAAAIPALFQSNVVDFEISQVDAPSISIGSPTFIDLSSFGLRVSVGDTPTGASGGPTPLALQTSWTWVAGTYAAGGSRFVGSLALNTASVDTFLGSLASKVAYFEVNLTLAGNRITIYQGTFTIFAVVDEGTSTVPTPTDSYMTKNENLATFLKKTESNGARVVLPSPNGVYAREFGCNDDGSPLDNIITL